MPTAKLLSEAKLSAQQARAHLAAPLREGEDPLKQRPLVLARFSSLHFYKTCPEYDRGESAANLKHLFRKYWLEALLLVLVVLMTIVLIMESSPAPGPGSQSFPRFTSLSPRVDAVLGVVASLRGS